MKQVLLTLLSAILFGITASAQEADSATDPPTFTQERDSAFAPLNKSRIPFNTLYDRVFQFAHLDQIQNDDTLTAGHYIQGLSELQRARYAAPVSDSFLNPENMGTFLKSENIRRRLPLLALNAQFAVFDTTAIADGRIDTAGGKYYDGSAIKGHTLTIFMHLQIQMSDT